MSNSFAHVWLIVPVFNEAEVVGDVIVNARKVFPNIVCIDDGSRDDSAQQARKAGAVVVRHPINLGQGASLQTGFEFIKRYTDARYCATFDADGQHQIDDVAAMVEAASKEDLSVVFGSRFLAEEIEAGFFKRVVLRTAATVTKWRTGMDLSDAHNGLRLLRRDALDHINLTQSRMAHASQIVAQIAASKVKWKEMPVHIRYTDYSRAKGQSILNSVNILVDLIVN